MDEIMMEITLLFNKMNEVNCDNEMHFGNSEISFSKIIYAITRGLNKEELFRMTNEELIRHIQKIQLIES